jgi:hypothetical protein
VRCALFVSLVRVFWLWCFGVLLVMGALSLSLFLSRAVAVKLLAVASAKLMFVYCVVRIVAENLRFTLCFTYFANLSCK